MGEMTEAEAAMMLAGALQTDLIYRLDYCTRLARRS
jgi:hypothetical protein